MLQLDSIFEDQAARTYASQKTEDFGGIQADAWRDVASEHKVLVAVDQQHGLEWSAKIVNSLRHFSQVSALEKVDKCQCTDSFRSELFRIVYKAWRRG